jgi:hypothetical protein
LAYRREGREKDARAILISKERQQRNQLGVGGWLWGLVQDVFIGYGYAPFRSIFWLIAILAAGTAYFWTRQPDPISADHPTWNPFVYVLDLLLPVVDLGQQNAFDPVGQTQAVALALVGVGWVLTAAVVAGVSRIINRQ